MDEIDLKIAWKSLSGNEDIVSSAHIAEACGLDSSPYSIAAVLLSIEEDSTYFYSSDGGFGCHTEEAIETQMEKRSKECKRQKEISDLLTTMDKV